MIGCFCYFQSHFLVILLFSVFNFFLPLIFFRFLSFFNFCLHRLYHETISFLSQKKKEIKKSFVHQCLRRNRYILFLFISLSPLRFMDGEKRRERKQIERYDVGSVSNERKGTVKKMHCCSKNPYLSPNHYLSAFMCLFVYLCLGRVGWVWLCL